MTDPTNAPARGLARIPFTADDERMMLAMAKWMRISAILAIVGAGLNAVAMVKAFQFGNIISICIQLLLALWLLTASKHFGLVASTDGSDQHHLAQGISNLRSIFLLKAVLLIVALALMLVALFGALAVGVFAASAR